MILFLSVTKYADLLRSIWDAVSKSAVYRKMLSADQYRSTRPYFKREPPCSRFTTLRISSPGDSPTCARSHPLNMLLSASISWIFCGPIHTFTVCWRLWTATRQWISLNGILTMKAEWYASLPDTEEGRAKVCHGILQRCVQSDNVNTYLKRGRQFGRQPDSNLVLRQFTDGIIRPLVNYLCERIEDGGNVLYLLDRFKMRCEWFKQEELHEQYVQTPSMGEKNLDKALREYLFDGGIQFPLPQPESPSGKADVVASLGTADPLVLEVKIFDPAKHKSTRNLQGGFQQIWKYVGNYNQSIGYLFIFNCSDKELVIEPTGDLESGRPNRVEFGGKIFFIVVANVNPNIPSASRQSPTDRVTITHEQLTATATD